MPGLGQAASATGLTRLGAMAPRAMGGGNVSRAAMSRVGPMTAAEVAGVQQGAALAKSTMVGTGLGFGSLYESSAADGDPDPWKALALSPLYGAAEAAVPAAITGAFRLKTGGYTGGLASRMAKGGAVTGIGETGTELFQTELELGLDPTLTSEERASARLNAAVAGGLVGGTFGTATGFKAGPQIRENEVGETDMAPSTAPPAPPMQEQLDLGLESTLFPETFDETGVPQSRPIPAETEVSAEVEDAVAPTDRRQMSLDLQMPNPQRDFMENLRAQSRQGLILTPKNEARLRQRLRLSGSRLLT